MPSPLIITENNGLRRQLQLQGRSLPYQGAVLVESEQRLEITFFPGNPVAYAQVLGPQLTGTTFSGIWKDKFLQDDENSPSVLNFPVITAAGQPTPVGANIITGANFTSSGAFPGTQTIKLSKTLRDAMDLLCRSGAHMRVEWSDWFRYGYLKNFKAWPGRGEDEWEWEAEFRWTGITDQQPKAQLDQLDNKSFIDTLTDLLAKGQALLFLPSQVSATYLQTALSDLADLVQQVERLITSLSGFVSFTFLPLTQLASVKAECYAVRDQVLAQLRAIADRDSRLDGARRLDTAATWENELLIRKVRQILELLGEEVAERLAQIEAASAGEIDRVYKVTHTTSLRAISREIFKTPDNWRDIAEFNGLASQIVETGMVLRIPKL